MHDLNAVLGFDSSEAPEIQEKLIQVLSGLYDASYATGYQMGALTLQDRYEEGFQDGYISANETNNSRV